MDTLEVLQGVFAVFLWSYKPLSSCEFGLHSITRGHKSQAPPQKNTQIHTFFYIRRLYIIMRTYESCLDLWA